MRRTLSLFLLVATLAAGCSDDGSASNNATTDPADAADQADVAVADSGADATADVASDASGQKVADSGQDTADTHDSVEPVLATTAVVVQSDADAGTSSYGLVQLRSGGELAEPEVRLGTPGDFGDGHVHVNATENGVYLMDTKSGRVRVLEKDDTPGGMSFTHLGDIELQASDAPDFAATPQWVGETGDAQTLVISLLGAGQLAKVSVDWENDTLGTPSFFDLSSHDDDGNPNPSIVLTDGNLAVVALQRLDPQGAAQDGKIIVWDVDTETTTRVVNLTTKLFHAGMKWLPDGHLAAGFAGEVATEGEPTLDSGILLLDRLAAGRFAPAGGFAISEQSLGGELWGFSFIDAQHGHAVVRTADGLKLVEFDNGVQDAPTLVSPVDTVPSPNGWIELADNSDHLWVVDHGDDTSPAGMRVLDTQSGELLDHDRLGFAGTPTSFAITESIEISPSSN